MIILENVSKTFGPKSILSDVNLQIEKNDYIALLGKSGTGKSTLLNIIGLLDIPTSGNIYYDRKLINAKKVSSYSMLRNKHFGFIFQFYHLMSTLTVEQNIQLPLLYSNKQIVKNELIQLTDTLGITDLLQRKCVNLSGGEKQRVAIARALIMRPEILICDEPTGNLDDENTKIILNVFSKQREEGKTLVVVTHDKGVADMADKIYLIENGGLRVCDN